LVAATPRCVPSGPTLAPVLVYSGIAPAREIHHRLLMFSHVVIFWTDPAEPNAPDEVLAGAKQYLASIPGVTNFHAGRMMPSHRDVVDQSYQVGLSIQFESKKLQDDYQVHSSHLEFIDKCKAFWTKVVVYDFE
jgi:Stress responsive A/B Barrel Domain